MNGPTPRQVLIAQRVYYVARRRISPVYLVDAAIQAGVLAGSPLFRPRR